MTPEEMHRRQSESRVVCCGPLRFLPQNDGSVRVEPVPGQERADAWYLTGLEAEKLCCWLTVRHDVAWRFIQDLRRERDIALESYRHLSESVNVPMDVSVLLSGPTLGERIKAAIVPHRTRSKPGPYDGSQQWLADQVGVPVMTITRYVKDLAVPDPRIAYRLAEVLDWSHAEMDRQLHAAKLRQVMKRHAPNGKKSQAVCNTAR